ncbi:MAG: glucose-1-phosphate thymidylyltransferase [Candidatus Poribacteria bacterium]|nr:MAG: glucose-1-phosphate thymidylyltransferase [Candidatus Poribacteria bacterium]
MIQHAIVLAAGEGRRIWPYGEFRQKCTLPVANVPAVRRLCQSLKRCGVEEIVLVVGHGAQQVRGATADIEGVRYVTQRVPDGTASATLLALETLPEWDTVLVLYGDIVTPTENLRQFIEAFQGSNCEAGLLVAPLGEESSHDWICASIGEGLLREVKGHPRGGSHRLCGVFAFRPAAVRYLLRNPGFAAPVDVGGMPPPEADLAASLQLMVEEGREVFAAESTEFFVDLDKPWHLLEANHRVVDYLCAHLERDVIGEGAEISDGAEIEGRVHLGRNTRIGRRVVLRGRAIVGANTEITNGAILKGNFVIGDRCSIRNYCEVGSSAIGDRCIIGHGAEFSGVLFKKVYLYHYCELWGVFGEATDIGAATVCGTLRFDDGETVHRIEGRPEVPPAYGNATYFGDFCRTGVNAILMPGVKVGSYCCIGPGVVLYEDVPSKTLLLAKQELIRKPWGPERYGW